MKVLLAEDEDKIAQLLIERLSDDGFTVEWARDGEEALKLLTSETYGIVLLDLMLPKLNGNEVLVHSRTLEKKMPPILALTAKSTDSDVIEGLDHGFDDYVTKPFSYDVLIARMRNAIRHGSADEPLLKLESLVVDPARKKILRKGKDIIVTPREFALLELLLRNKGVYFTESQLIETLWDRNYEGMSNVVAVHIKNLRNKIDKAFPQEKQLLISSRNYGYKIDG